MTPEEEKECRAMGATDHEISLMKFIIRSMDGKVIGMGMKGENGETKLLHKHPGSDNRAGSIGESD